MKKERRWKAVHLACHGLVDTERPTLSSLALTPTEKEDGFLTRLEVFSMDVPADLVALSACETGKGSVVRAEGIVGLARAFVRGQERWAHPYYWAAWVLWGLVE